MDVALHLFDQPYLELAGQRHELPLVRPVYLLLYLACRGDWVGREELAALFRPDADEQTARHNLRLLLTRARRYAFAEGLEVESKRLRWRVPSDLARFRVALGRGDWAEAVALYRGPLLDLGSTNLAGYDAWLELEQSTLETGWQRAARQHSDALSAQGDHGQAAQLLGRVWQRDPLAEDVLQGYLQSAYLAGQRNEALRAFATFYEQLRTELDLEPLEATVQLVDTIRRAAPLPHHADLHPGSRFGVTLNQPTASVPLGVLRPPKLVGREREQTALRTAPTTVVLVAGEPGIGKTRLLQESLPDVRWLRCREGLARVPYYPLLSTLRAQPLPDLGAYRRDLARLLPELASEPPPPVDDPASAKTRLLEALARVLEATTAQGRGLVIDDMQWADPATLELVCFVASRETVRLYGAYRSSEVSPALEHMLESLRSSRALTVIPLGPLAERTLQALLGALSDNEDGPPRFSRWLFGRSGGNPFFALETLKALFASGRLRSEPPSTVASPAATWHSDLDAISHDYAELEVPASVAGVVRRRISGLSERARRVLEVASVVGEGFSAQLVQHAAGLSEWATQGAIAEAEASAVLRSAGFSHDLMRQTVYADLSPSRRSFLHAKVAEALDQGDPLIVAEHWFAAGDDARAAAACYEAACRFDNQGLDDEAITLYERIARLDIATPERYRAMASLCEAYRVTNRHDEAYALIDTILAQSSDTLAKTTALNTQAVLYLQHGRLEAAAEVAAEALASAALLDDPLSRHNAIMVQTMLAYQRGQFDKAHDLVAPVIEALRGEDNPFLLANWLGTQASNHSALGCYDEARRDNQEALDIAAALGARRMQVLQHSNLLAVALYAGRVSEDLSAAEAALELGEFDSSYALRYHLSRHYLARGRRQEAHHHATLTLHHASTPRLRVSALITLAEIEHTCNPGACEAWLDQASDIASKTDSPAVHALLIAAVLRHGNARQLERIHPWLGALEPHTLPAFLRADVERALALGRHTPDAEQGDAKGTAKR